MKIFMLSKYKLTGLSEFTARNIISPFLCVSLAKDKKKEKNPVVLHSVVFDILLIYY